MAQDPLLSVVVPLFDEELTIPELHRRIRSALAGCTVESEIIYVNDGSRDDSWLLLEEIARSDSRTVVIDLARNFGHQVAISAGLDFARGGAIVLMDGDLQDPPELIPEMVKKWRDGFDVVYAVKRSRQEGLLWRMAFRAFYLLLNRFSSVPIPPEAGNFSLMTREVVDVLRAMPERNRFLPGMRAWAGFRQAGLTFDRDARFAGKPKMSLRQLLHLGNDALFSFSKVPLRLAMLLGTLVASGGFLIGAWALWTKFFTDRASPGWASNLFATFFTGGCVLLTLGIIGEYVARIYDEVKRRPLYTLRSSLNLRRGGESEVDPASSRPRSA
jgi:polyisoprenyl-phosphate glycosyltransferase